MLPNVQVSLLREMQSELSKIRMKHVYNSPNHGTYFLLGMHTKHTHFIVQNGYIFWVGLGRFYTLAWLLVVTWGS